MKKLLIIYIVSFTVSGLLCTTPAAGQEYFLKDLRIEAKVTPFCNNTPNKDMAPLVWNNTLFVTSSRETAENKDNINPKTGTPYLSVYAFDTKCNPKNLDFLPATLNSKFNSGPLAVSQDTTLVIITKNYPKGNRKKVQNLYLAYYVKDGGIWSDEKQFPFGDINVSMQHPFYDDKNKTLYFSSDLEGGYGKFDIWKSEWDGKAWLQPANMGAEINSPFNEVFPGMTPDGDLLYTTDHPETNGGLDIVLFRDGKRHLLPEPFNTIADDFSMSYENISSGFLSSDRDPATREDNVFSFDLSVSYVVRVLDRETKEGVGDAVVTFNGGQSNVNGSTKTSSTGEATIFQGIQRPFSVSLEVRKDGYKPLIIDQRDFITENDFWVLTAAMEPLPKASTLGEDTEDDTPGDYYIIVGSFRNMGLAKKRAEWLRVNFKQNIIILPTSVEGFNRLSNGKYSTRTEALEASEDFKINNNADAWILKVPK